jgi:hypothetical protein
MLLNEQSVMEEIGGGLKNFLETDENKNSTYKNL